MGKILDPFYNESYKSLLLITHFFGKLHYTWTRGYGYVITSPKMFYGSEKNNNMFKTRSPSVWTKSITGWCFQPIWKNMLVKLGSSSASFGPKIKIFETTS